MVDVAVLCKPREILRLQEIVVRGLERLDYSLARELPAEPRIVKHIQARGMVVPSRAEKESWTPKRSGAFPLGGIDR